MSGATAAGVTGGGGSYRRRTAGGSHWHVRHFLGPSTSGEKERDAVSVSHAGSCEQSDASLLERGGDASSQRKTRENRNDLYETSLKMCASGR